MASFAIAQQESFEAPPARRFYIRLNSAAADTDCDFTVALYGAVEKTNADVAIIYRLDKEASEFQAIARHTHLPVRIPDVGATLSNTISRWIEELAGPAQGRATDDARFEKLPEVTQHRLKRVLLMPLRGAEGLLGLLTIGRSEDREFDESEIGVAERTGRLLAAAIDRDALERNLKERKLIERAKGILQRKLHMTEEQAYLKMRDVSRNRRLPMAELAREIIDNQILVTPARRTRVAWPLAGCNSR